SSSPPSLPPSLTPHSLTHTSAVSRKLRIVSRTPYVRPAPQTFSLSSPVPPSLTRIGRRPPPSIPHHLASQHPAHLLHEHLAAPYEACYPAAIRPHSPRRQRTSHVRDVKIGRTVFDGGPGGLQQSG
ncbi:hypothetical protein Vafri_4104, partial [Volvox africanus]